ncbi:MAG: hypothetical protein ACK5BE_00385, partial [Alphaproteobacteria bacterium]
RAFWTPKNQLKNPSRTIKNQKEKRYKILPKKLQKKTKIAPHLFNYAKFFRSSAPRFALKASRGAAIRNR